MGYISDPNVIRVEPSGAVADELNALKADITTEKFLFIGDSYAQGYSPDGTTVGWPQQVKNLCGISDTNYYEYSVGGYGFTTSPGFIDLLNNAINDMTVDERNRVKYLIVGGGYNDAVNYANIGGNITTFADNCKLNFPNANVLICPFGWCVEGLTTGVHVDQKITNLINMVAEYQRGAVTNGLGYVEGINSVLHKNVFFSSDYVHPTDDGQYNIGLALANYLKTRTFSTIEYMQKFNCFADNVYETGITFPIPCTATVERDRTTLQIGTGTITGSFSSIKLNGQDILLGTVKSATINGCSTNTFIHCSGVLKTTSAKYYSVNFTLKIIENKLYMSIVKMNSTNSDFDTLSFDRLTIYSKPSPVTVNSLYN